MTGANGVNNYTGALLKALEADAVRPGLNGVVNNWGRIVSVTTAGNSATAWTRGRTPASRSTTTPAA